MANLQAVPLTDNELYSGFNYKWQIDFDDVNVITPSTDTAIVPLYTLTLQSTVVTQCMYRLVTAFDASDASINSCTIIVGDTSDDDRFMTAQELAEDGTEVPLWITPNAVDTLPYGYKTGDTPTVISAKFVVAGGASPTVGELTSGQVIVLMKILEVSSV